MITLLLRDDLWVNCVLISLASEDVMCPIIFAEVLFNNLRKTGKEDLLKESEVKQKHELWQVGSYFSFFVVARVLLIKHVSYMAGLG